MSKSHIRFRGVIGLQLNRREKQLDFVKSCTSTFNTPPPHLVTQKEFTTLHKLESAVKSQKTIANCIIHFTHCKSAIKCSVKSPMSAANMS